MLFTNFKAQKLIRTEYEVTLVVVQNQNKFKFKHNIKSRSHLHSIIQNVFTIHNHTVDTPYKSNPIHGRCVHCGSQTQTDIN